MSDTARIKFLKRQRHGKQRPVIHLLMSDGRVSEFHDLCVAFPDADNDPGDHTIYWMPVNRSCVPMETPEGLTPLLTAPAFSGAIQRSPDELWTFKQVANAAKVSVSTIKRDIDA